MSQSYAQAGLERREGRIHLCSIERSGAMIEAREQRVRERFVAIEEAKMLRDQLPVLMRGRQPLSKLQGNCADVSEENWGA